MGPGMISVVTPRMVIEQCAQRGINREELLDAMGVSSSDIQTPSGRIPIEKMYLLWDHAIRLTHDRMLASHTAEAVPFGTYRLLDYLLAASATPGEALLRSSQLFGLMNNTFTLSFHHHHDEAHLELSNPRERRDIPHPYVEYIFATYLARLRFITQADLRPTAIHFTCAEPEGASAYMHAFRSPVRFGQAANRMILPRCVMDVRHPLADQELCELLESHARRQLTDPCCSKPAAEIYEALAGNLEAGKASLPFLARTLAKSCRNLQREIHAHGLTFRELLDQVRQQRAHALLNEQDLPIAEVAEKLLFSSASSFCHAFQRWTGQSPHEYRKRGPGSEKYSKH